jgi:hypothetical protein
VYLHERRCILVSWADAPAIVFEAGIEHVRFIETIYAKVMTHKGASLAHQALSMMKAL